MKNKKFKILLMASFVLPSCTPAQTSNDKGSQGGYVTNDDTLLYGNEAPNESLGKNGDVYLNLYTWDYYAKENGKWSLSENVEYQSEKHIKDTEIDNNGYFVVTYEGGSNRSLGKTEDTGTKKCTVDFIALVDYDFNPPGVNAFVFATNVVEIGSRISQPAPDEERFFGYYATTWFLHDEMSFPLEEDSRPYGLSVEMINNGWNFAYFEVKDNINLVAYAQAWDYEYKLLPWSGDYGEYYDYAGIIGSLRYYKKYGFPRFVRVDKSLLHVDWKTKDGTSYGFSGTWKPEFSPFGAEYNDLSDDDGRLVLYSEWEEPDCVVTLKPNFPYDGCKSNYYFSGSIVAGFAYEDGYIDYCYPKNSTDKLVDFSLGVAKGKEYGLPKLYGGSYRGGGYRFKGWQYSAPDVASYIIPETGIWKYSSDVTLTAVWEQY